MRAVLYLRQSKDAGLTGLAVDRQRTECRRLAAERGWTVVEECVDNDTSASTGKHRPGYQRALHLAEAGDVEVVVAWHVDRLTRRVAELESLIELCERTGVRVATVSGDLDLTTDAGRLVGRILGAVARGEVERKSARQKLANQQKAGTGCPPARRAFGHTLDGSPHPEEAPALRDLCAQVVAGLSINSSTKWLNSRGFTTTTGKLWNRNSVAKMLANPRNAGHRTYKGEIVAEGTWEPAVSEELYRATVDTIAARSYRRATPPARRHLGSNLYRCHCGAPVRANYSHHSTRVYQCTAGAHLSRSADPIDTFVRDVITARLRRPDIAELLTPDLPDVAPLREEAQRLRLRLDRLGSDYADGLLTGRQVQVATADLEGKLVHVEAQLASAGRGNKLGGILSAPDPGQSWLDAPLDIQRAVLDTLAQVTVERGTPGRARDKPIDVNISWRG